MPRMRQSCDSVGHSGSYLLRREEDQHPIWRCFENNVFEGERKIDVSHRFPVLYAKLKRPVLK